MYRAGQKKKEIQETEMDIADTDTGVEPEVETNTDTAINTY